MRFHDVHFDIPVHAHYSIAPNRGHSGGLTHAVHEIPAHVHPAVHEHVNADVLYHVHPDALIQVHSAVLTHACSAVPIDVLLCFQLA